MTARPWVAIAASLWLAASAAAAPPAPAAPGAPPAPSPGGRPGAPAPGTQPDGARYAVVVGVNDYDHQKQWSGLRPLSFAIEDAHQLADLLTEQGYKVTLMTTRFAAKSGDDSLRPKAANIRAKLDEVLGQTAAGDTVLVALTGHGFRLKGDAEQRDFFAPADAKPSLDQTASLISIPAVIKRLEGSRASARMLLVDACRSVLDASGKEVPIANQSVNPAVPSGVHVLLSCKAGQKSFEDDELKHGIFTYFVLEALSDYTGRPTAWKGLSLHVRDNVAAVARKKEQGDQDPVDINPPAGAGPVIVQLAEPRRLVAPFSADRAQEYQKLWARHLKKDWEETIQLAPGVTIKLMLIPPGEFTMGASRVDGGQPGDTPHRVVLTRHYYMGEFEVTQKQFNTISKLSKTHKYTWKGENGASADNLPADTMSFQKAQDFCEQMSALLRAKDGWDDYKCRLPTEAEWEYACRAGTDTTYSSGRSLDLRQANCAVPDAQYLGRTEQVGRYPRNAFRLADMHGNVAEWCSDWYAAYPSRLVRDPTGPKSATPHRILRGGHYMSDPAKCRSAARAPLSVASAPEAVCGFRIVIATK